MKQISGFSRLSKAEKIDWLTKNYFQNTQKAKELLLRYWNKDEKLQQLHDEISENTLSNYYLPFGVAPNFLINGKTYCVPMVIEESSVVAAASKAAKFWQHRGGFKAEVIDTLKTGQVHFLFKGDQKKLFNFFEKIKPQLLSCLDPLTRNMEKRGGGLHELKLEDKTELKDGYFQLNGHFKTADAMGANFINSCLEKVAHTFTTLSSKEPYFSKFPIEVIMAILSNYVPECKVKVSVSWPVEQLMENAGESKAFAQKFVEAIEIAEKDPFRAVTHNKGVMNGIDAVVLATGNDFRAVEACAHAFAGKGGQYTSLTHAEIREGLFRFWIEIPLALGTVGGLTRLHPLVKLALEMLNNPSAKELMSIVAATGLAQNFGAISSLVTTGIQAGHMKMHLFNILNQFGATRSEKAEILSFFRDKTVTHRAVLNQLEKIRN